MADKELSIIITYIKGFFDANGVGKITIDTHVVRVEDDYWARHQREDDIVKNGFYVDDKRITPAAIISIGFKRK